MKSQLNKLELSILLMLSKYFTDPKFVFAFGLTSFLNESSITKTKKKGAKIVCVLLSCNHFESELRRTPLQQRLREIAFPWLYGIGGTADKI